MICFVDGTVRLDRLNQLQPDVFLLIDPDRGGQTTLSGDHDVEGPPELLIEISVSSQAFDLKEKREIYRKSRVSEYLVWRVLDRAIDWFIPKGNDYDLLSIGEDGLSRSEIFPGLWLDPQALIQGDLSALFRAVQLGLASPKHATFVAALGRVEKKI